MKLLQTILIACILLISCNGVAKNDAPSKVDHSDPEFIRIRDSIMASAQNEANASLEASNCPIKILKSKIVSSETGTYKNVFLSYKNISKKKVIGIKFKWYATNVFGEPADMGAFSNGWGSGFTENILKPNALENSTFEVLSKDAKKIDKAFAYEVVFSDNSKWKSRQ